MAVFQSVSVSSVSSQVLEPAPPAQPYGFIAIGNTGAKTAYLKFFPEGGNLTVVNGIPLPPGASVLLDQDSTPVMNSGVYAICATGETTTLAIQAY